MIVMLMELLGESSPRWKIQGVLPTTQSGYRISDLGNGDGDCDTNSCEGKGRELKPTSGSAALQVQADLQDLGEESRREALWRQ